ncbi:mutator type transposase [Tanacetum coccineum]
MQLRELRRIGKQTNKGPNTYYFYLGQQFASKKIVKGRVKKHSVETRRQLILVKNDNERVSVRCEGTIPAMVPYVAIDNNTDKNVFSQTKGGPSIRENIKSGKQNILGKDKIVEGKDGKHIHENMKSPFKEGVYKEMLWNTVKATSEGEFKKKMSELKSFNSDAYDWLMKIPLEQWSRAHFSGRAKSDLLINNTCEVFNRQLIDGRDQPIITCLEYIREYLMKKIVVVQKVIAKTVGPLTPSVTKMFDAIKKRLLSAMLNEMEEMTGIPCKHVVAAIYNMSENSVGVGIPEQWVHAAYRLETWAHVYSFKVNPCNGRVIWPVVESRTAIILPLYKPPIGRPPKKRNKSNDEIASQSASSGKLSRKGKLVSCGKCGNVGHNRKGCRGQSGGSSQDGAKKVSGQAAGATNVSGQADGVRKVSGQVADVKKASSQPSAAQSTAKQGPRQGFQGPIAGPASGS